MPERPTPEECEWLLRRTAQLIATAGPARFVAAPILRTGRAAFPDAYRSDPASLQCLARRLLHHAGLTELRAKVRDLRSAERFHDDLALHATVMPYVGIEGGAAIFELDAIGDDDVVGSLSHDVGRVFCDARCHDAAAGDPFRAAAAGEDEGAHTSVQIGSLATIYLGFGVLAANAAYHPRSKGKLRGNFSVGARVIDQAGGLPEQALAYLLALQAVVRDHDDPAYGDLLPNQAKDLADWREALAPRRAELIARLGLAPEADWPAPRSLDLEPFVDEVYDDAEGLAEEVRHAHNRGQRVYRVKGFRTGSYGFFGLVAGGLGALALAGPLGRLALLAVGAGTASGVVVGRRTRADACSDGACRYPLPAAAITCPRCGGTIAGEIDRPDQRLDAEEADGGGDSDA